MQAGYRLLLTAAGSWFVGWGIQMVIYPWLLVSVLEETPARVGAAQMTVTLPSLLFILLGGATADRLEPRRVLAGVHLGAAAGAAVLCAALLGGALSYSLLVIYGFAIGTFQAFGLPARDTQLSHVVTTGMSRAVAGATVTQHAGQIVGAFVAGAAGWAGASPVLGTQMAILAFGAIPALRLPARPPEAGTRAPIVLADIVAGLREVSGSPILRPVLIVAVSTGLFYVGPFLVIIPVMVRDVYGGGAPELAVITAMFPLGAVLGGLVIVLRGGIARNGRALAVGQLAGASCMTAIAYGLPFAGTVAAVLGWGVSGALFINAGRTLFQERASPRNRARVLSVYTLGVMGGGSVGSLLSGYLATFLGLHGALAFDAAVAIVITLAVIAFMRLLSLD